VLYASEDYMSSFFDVTASDSALSGLPQFDADAAFRDVGISLMGMWHLNQAWHIAGGFEYKLLLGDAADSPVVDQRGDENQISVGVSLLYSW
jgi:outer membrane protein